MSADTRTDLTFIARQLRPLTTDVASARGDVSVLTAIAMRQDGTPTATLAELRAMHSQHARLTNHVLATTAEPVRKP